MGNPGGGICCEGSDCTIYKNHIHNNENQDGAGIGIVNCSPTISHNLIYDNYAFDLGGGIRCDFSTPTLVNNTITQNNANEGGGIYCVQSTPLIVNTICWDNTANVGNEIIGSPMITYSDIRGGYPGEGNIDDNPLFVDPGMDEFRLQEDSPCIDAGDPASPLDPDSTRADIGALYYHQFTRINPNNIESAPNAFHLSQNYPNPFNTSTTLSYTISQSRHISLSIYNISGQRVVILYDGLQQPGTHTLIWNASDAPSGIYFARIQYGNHIETNKIVLLK